MKQNFYPLLGLGFLVPALAALPGMAQSAMWVVERWPEIEHA